MNMWGFALGISAGGLISIVLGVNATSIIVIQLIGWSFFLGALFREKRLVTFKTRDQGV